VERGRGILRSWGTGTGSSTVLILKSAFVSQTSLFQLSSYDSQKRVEITRKGRGKGNGKKSKRQEKG
jgi:hypothetical protein